MENFTVVYIDDQLSSEKQTLERKTYLYLEDFFLRNILPIKLLGFYKFEDAEEYFREGKCDLIISDRNIFWGKQDDGSYLYRYGHDYFKYVLNNRPDLKNAHVIVYTDSPCLDEGY